MQRIGVFVCHCGTNIAGTVDVKAVAQALKNEPGVVFSTDYQYMCSQAGQDIIKAAMVAVYRRLEREGLRARLLLQVHDELIIEAPPEEAEQVKILLTEEMENAFPLSVRLQADVSEGENWYEAKK